MKIPRVTLLALIKAAPSPTSAKKAPPAPVPAVKGRPRTATQHTGFHSVQRAMQKNK